MYLPSYCRQCLRGWLCVLTYTTSTSSTCRCIQPIYAYIHLHVKRFLSLFLFHCVDYEFRIRLVVRAGYGDISSHVQSHNVTRATRSCISHLAANGICFLPLAAFPRLLHAILYTFSQPLCASNENARAHTRVHTDFRWTIRNRSLQKVQPFTKFVETRWKLITLVKQQSAFINNGL